MFGSLYILCFLGLFSTFKRRFSRTQLLLSENILKGNLFLFLIEQFEFPAQLSIFRTPVLTAFRPTFVDNIDGFQCSLFKGLPLPGMHNLAGKKIRPLHGDGYEKRRNMVNNKELDYVKEIKC